MLLFLVLAPVFPFEYDKTLLYFRRAIRAERAPSDRGPHGEVQHPGEARPQRVRPARAQGRAHAAADHRCGELR